MLWRHLNLPDPTPLQLSMAYSLQHDPESRRVIMAFRGAAKSWITAAFTLWNLYRDPQLKVLVASGSVRRSVAFVNFCLQLIGTVPCLKHLQPKNNQRQSSMGFDVGPSLPDQTASMSAFGITAQIVGARADIIVGDDVETNTNSMTDTMRSKLADAVKEFDAILKPGGIIIFLGTPQTEASIYIVLQGRGYVIKIWPALFPNTKQQKAYGSHLAEYIRHQIELNPKVIGNSTEPTRFSNEDLAGRSLSWGKSGFALQFMLDTSLSDVEKYPLRLRDLIVMSLDPERGPDTVSWGTGEHLVLNDVQAVGLSGDRLYGPASTSESFSKYERRYGFVDPSGKGADEATLTLGGVVHARPFVLKQAGWLDGSSQETFDAMAEIIVSHKLLMVRVESDFGMETYGQLLRNAVDKAWKLRNKALRIPEKEWKTTKIETVTAKKVSKELRIVNTLEPLFNSHRIVIAKEVFEEDFQQVQKRDGTATRDRYSLMYQITRLTKEKGCLTHDDRVEGISGLMDMYSDILGLDPDVSAESAAIEDALADLEKRYGPGIVIGDDGSITPGSIRRQIRGGLLSGRRRHELMQKRRSH